MLKTETPTTPEQGFRETLEEVQEFVGRVSPYFKSLDELYIAVKLALENEGQFRLMYAAVVVQGRK